MKIDVIGQLLK